MLPRNTDNEDCTSCVQWCSRRATRDTRMLSANFARSNCSETSVPAGCKRNWAQSSARTTKIRAQFSARTTHNLAQFRARMTRIWSQSSTWTKRGLGTILQTAITFCKYNFFFFFSSNSGRALCNRAGRNTVRAGRNALRNMPSWNTGDVCVLRATGQDTVASTLSFLLNELGQNPEVCRKWVATSHFSSLTPVDVTFNFNYKNVFLLVTYLPSRVIWISPV